MRLLTTSVLLLAASLARAAEAPVQSVTQDDRSVTFKVQVPSYRVLSPGPDGRVSLVAPGLELSSVPGRPDLPAAVVRLAMPAGSRPVARVIAVGEEEVRDGIQIAIGARASLREDRGGLGVSQQVEQVAPILDGAWPREQVELGKPFTMRRQQIVVAYVRPFRYDESARRLYVRNSLTVRVEFAGVPATATLGVAAEDRHFEPVLERALLNYEQGRRWRVPSPASVRRGSSLFPDRGTPPGERVAAFDEDEPEVRVLADSSAVYAIAYTDLAQHGYPGDVPIAEVSIHRHEFVQGGTPSYVTYELPIEVVDGDDNGFFDGEDYIFVWTQNWARRSKATVAQRYWGDGEVLYVTRLRGGTGARVLPRAGWRDQLLTPLASYPWTQHWEQNRFFMPVPRDTNADPFHWTEITQYAKRDSFYFETNDLDNTKLASFTISLHGRKGNTRLSWVYLRNATNTFTTITDSSRWTGMNPQNFVKSDVPGANLSEGLTNVVHHWGRDYPTGVVANVAVNWFETTYWRRYRALDGYLSCNSGGVPGYFQIDASGFFSTRVRVYDVSDSLNPRQLTVDPSHITLVGSRYTVSFQDSAVTGQTKRYIVFEVGRAVPPEGHTNVTRRSLSTLATGDYLLIAPEAFLPAAQTLADFRRSQGLDVVLAPLEAVQDEFNGGRKSSHAIRRFIRHAYDNWDARFVLLLGDGSEDPRHYIEDSGPDWVPLQRVTSPVGVFDGAGTVYEAIPSDPWYVWCVDCSTSTQFAIQDKVHDLFIGRLPVNTLQNANEVVAKLIAYENVTPDQIWRRKMLLSSDDYYSTISFFGGGGMTSIDYCKRLEESVFQNLSEKLRDIILVEAGLTQSRPFLFNLQYYLRDEPVIPEDLPDSCRVDWFSTQRRTHSGVTPILLDSLNAGNLIWNYQGHANQYVLAHEYMYVNRGDDDDSKYLANFGMPFLFTAFSCHPNSFGVVSELNPHKGPAIGEEVVILPNRGAVGSWASSGYEILPSPTFVSDHINTDLFRAMFVFPPVDEGYGRGDRVVFGQAVALAVFRTATRETFDPTEGGVGLTYNLLGDPATRISVGAAQTVVTANGVPVENNVPVRLTSSGDTLRLEADIRSNVAITTLTLERASSTGTVVIPPSEYTVTPAFPEPPGTGGGGRRYHLVYRTTLEATSSGYVLRYADANGVASTFSVVLALQTSLRVGNGTIQSGDPVGASAVLSVRILSPAQIQPSTDMQIRVDGQLHPFNPTQIDAVGREWDLVFLPGPVGPPWPPGDHEIVVYLLGEIVATYTFTVSDQLRLANLMAFPNPFDDERGTQFTFTMEGPEPYDLRIRVYTVLGKLVYERTERSLLPGYQALAWNGLDAEGSTLANGVYLYVLQAKSGSRRLDSEGRLVKLRRPHRTVEPEEESK